MCGLCLPIRGRKTAAGITTRGGSLKATICCGGGGKSENTKNTLQTKYWSQFPCVTDSIHRPHHWPTLTSKGHHDRELPCSCLADALLPHTDGNVLLF